MSQPRKIELLAPASNFETAKEAILHGADAVYIGGPSHGARKNVANSLSDIQRLTEFAHIFRSRVYVTVNTIIYDNELRTVEKMIGELYRIGVDALIIQDMGILRMDIPPIALHASTQCDNRTPQKAKFLEEVGFSQIVLARELTLDEIRDVCRSVSIPVETFIHGALCVSYSGRCHASYTCLKRSANRGECAQICRLPFDLVDRTGKIISRNKHLLSLKDFNASGQVEAILNAGVSSLKIEGRLKEPDYVKNVTAAYRKIIDDIISNNPDKYLRSSAGLSNLKFTPQLEKSFNRGFTTYFLESRKPNQISQPSTPKSMGEIINDVSLLNNGDGISFFNEKGEYTGVMVNGLKNNSIIGNRPFFLPKGSKIHRTFDKEWQKKLAQPTAERKLKVDFLIDEKGVYAKDERGAECRIAGNFIMEEAKKPMDYFRIFSKLGNTHFDLNSLEVRIPGNFFIPASQITDIRRKTLEKLDVVNKISYPFEYRRRENENALYPIHTLTFSDNVANSLAEKFYSEHGATVKEKALEVQELTNNSENNRKSRIVMTTRHCILREMGKCKKEGKHNTLNFPLKLKGDKLEFLLDFDCSDCEMHVIKPF